MHVFSESLAASHKVSDLPIWEEIYRKSFPGFEAMVDHRQDGEHQRAGIDRSVILSNSKQLLVDEKARERNKKTGRVYDDIALEYLSDEARRTPGWVCKALRADYIAYAILPLGKCYLLPVIQLQMAWARFGADWIERFPKVRAENPGYWTVSVGVPPTVLFPAIGGAFRVDFTPVQEAEPPAPVETDPWVLDYERELFESRTP